MLLGFATGLSESQLFAFPESEVSPDAGRRFERLLQRRLRGEPVAYLTETREFYGRRFHVDPRVLIPRPETEHLVDLVLELPLPERPRILDLGTGSGCIAITLAAELPGARLWSIDRSLAALAVAGLNAARNGVAERLQRIASDWASALPSTFARDLDLVVTNPPYIDRNQPSEYSTDVSAHEPGGALFAAESGIADYRRLFRWRQAEAPTVPMITEIGRGQLPILKDLARHFELAPTTVRNDYSGIERIVLWS